VEAAPETSRFAVLAYPFLLAEERFGSRGVVVEAGADWSFAAEDVRGAERAVWGRLPGRPAAPLRGVAAREAALHRLRLRMPAPLRVTAVHRLPGRGLRGGLRGAASSALRGGALVELRAPGGGARVLDAVAAAAGAAPVGAPVHAGSGGAVLVRVRLRDGRDAMLRVARAGSPGDPLVLADTLDRLAAAGVPLAPRPLARGVTAGAAWTAEEALTGRPPVAAGGRLVAQVVEACRRFPRRDMPPTAPVEDLLAAAALLPDRAPALRRLAAEVETGIAPLPAVYRHGDLWTGNMLVDRGRLTGLVDWDAAHPGGVPGADLVQLVGTDARRRAGLHLGPAFLAGRWRAPATRGAAAAYWRAAGVAPEHGLQWAGIAWWATEVHHTLRRLPHRAADEEWVRTNVDQVLAALVG
jgi:Ser/Thr protein kinase RdoA (MazF antagonist)